LIEQETSIYGKIQKLHEQVAGFVSAGFTGSRR
jgi:hypothetical protein